MSLLRIAWRSIQQRGVASLLTMVSMGLGVMLVVSVLLIMGIVSESFQNNASLGYNVIVGARGGKLQLVLNTVFHLSQPVENIPYSFYKEFLPANQRQDGRKGEFSDLVSFAIPMCMGDFFENFRVVGTTPQLFDEFEYDAENGRKYEFASGRNLQSFSKEYGYFEAVLGSKVAEVTGLQTGDTFAPTHGSSGDTHDIFFVVGVLKHSGTPNDRAVFVNIEGFYLLKDHAKTDYQKTCPLCGKPWSDEEAPVDHDHVADELALPTSDQSQFDQSQFDHRLTPERRMLRPLPEPQREVTSILVRTINPMVSRGLVNTINEGRVAQAVSPISEILTLYQTFVRPLQMVLLLFTITICVVSGVSILVSIYNSMSDRKHEIAVMRALGAGRRTVMLTVLLESIILSLAGGLGGWMCGHLLIGLAASKRIANETGVEIGVFDFAPGIELNPAWSTQQGWEISAELLLVPGLILLAIVVGLLPALYAYRTDVARALSSSP
ncbi:MAG: FtsX-like permease family protein [Pirellulaceae bacterium]|nr:ABC transporter permease [Planctomycetales bacterium]